MAFCFRFFNNNILNQKFKHVINSYKYLSHSSRLAFVIVYSSFFCFFLFKNKYQWSLPKLYALKKKPYENVFEEVPNNIENKKGSTSTYLTRSFIADAASKIFPSVVNISNTMANDFSKNAVGSGFIITNDGKIITNAHVITLGMNYCPSEVIVTLFSGKHFKAKILALDTSCDIALLQIKNLDITLSPATLGKSKSLIPGEFVVAVGAPFFLNNSVTAGIVSAIRRGSDLPTHNQYQLEIENSRIPYIQTDASINIGNSGGPLINLDGEVIGINTLQIKSLSGDGTINLAIAIDYAKIIIEQLEKYGKVSRPYIGCNIITLSPEIIELYLQKDPQLACFLNQDQKGVLVVSVNDSRGPAAKIGLQPLDIIIKADDETIYNANQLFDIITFEKIDHVVKLSILRQDHIYHLNITPTTYQLH